MCVFSEDLGGKKHKLKQIKRKDRCKIIIEPLQRVDKLIEHRNPQSYYEIKQFMCLFDIFKSHKAPKQ